MSGSPDTMAPGMPTGTQRSGGSRATREWWRALGSLFAAGALCACASTTSAAAPTAPAGVLLPPSAAADLPQSAETLRADVTVSGVHLGRVESTWCPDTAGGRVQTEMKPAALVKALLQASGRAQTQLELPGGAALVSDYDLREGEVVRSYHVSYHEGRYDYRYDKGGVPQLEGMDDVPEQARAHDMQSALMVLRAWRPRLNETSHFYVVLGRRLWRADVRSAGPEVIKIGGVPQLTTRIDGTARRLWDAPDAPGPRQFSIWFGEQPERVPVRLTADGKYGPVTMTLTERSSGLAACQPASDPTASLTPN
jgi:uncharacterized protein DUF3108